MATMDSASRRVFFNADEIPSGVKALGIQVKYPFITLVAEERGVEHREDLCQYAMVYVEITPEEWASAQGDQGKINALAVSFGDLVQEALGADWHRWND